VVIPWSRLFPPLQLTAPSWKHRRIALLFIEGQDLKAGRRHVMSQYVMHARAFTVT
jgi:hypothetical protein